MLEGIPPFVCTPYALMTLTIVLRLQPLYSSFQTCLYSIAAKFIYFQNMQSEFYRHHSVAPCPEVRAVFLVDKATSTSTRTEVHSCHVCELDLVSQHLRDESNFSCVSMELLVGTVHPAAQIPESILRAARTSSTFWHVFVVFAFRGSHSLVYRHHFGPGVLRPLCIAPTLALFTFRSGTYRPSASITPNYF